jgi:hypothetical protein
MAAPMPRPAPVTTAARSVSLNRSRIMPFPLLSARGRLPAGRLYGHRGTSISGARPRAGCGPATPPKRGPRAPGGSSTLIRS